MSTELRERSPLEETIGKLRSPSGTEQIKLALGKSDRLVDRFIRAAVTALQQTPELITVEEGTLWRAFIRCAQDGLLPDGREAAVTIDENRSKGTKEARYMPMVGGYRKIAANHGISLEAFVVFENDHFDYELGFEPRCEHKPPKLGEPRGGIIGAYAVATDARGQKYLEVMDRWEIAAVRSVSRGGDKAWSPWAKWEAEMTRKTPCRRLFKTLPLGELSEMEVETLRAADDEAELPEQPKMSVEEANLSASLAGRVPVDEPGPVDALPAPEEQRSFEELAAAAQQRRDAQVRA